VTERLIILRHFIRTRWGPRPRSRSRLQAFQQKRIARFLRNVVRQSPFYKGIEPELDHFPVMTKPGFLRNFTALNRHGITLEEATLTALRAENERDFRPLLRGGVTVGLSSGTSGSRQAFLVSRDDRCRWAGQMLALMLSRASLLQIITPFRRPLRIALFLRATSNLYTTLASARIRFDYYDLTRPLDELLAGLAGRCPDVLVAPATVLAELARREIAAPCGIRPSQVISVAEVLDARDRELIESAFGVRVAEIYQAAEGFLGHTCEAGRMHLNEESLHIEPRWIDGSHDRFYPVITDFSRNTQWFVRHHLDDILRVDTAPCPCGRASLTLRTIEGRADEVLRARNAQGKLEPVFPDPLRQALYAMRCPPGLYRIAQHGGRWDICLQPDDDRMQQAVRSALENLLGRLGLTPPEFRFLPWTDQAPGEKQKRIRCITLPT